MGFLPTGCGSCCEQERSPVSTSLEATQETLVVFKLKHVWHEPCQNPQSLSGTWWDQDGGKASLYSNTFCGGCAMWMSWRYGWSTVRADLCKLCIVYKTHKHFHSLWMCRVGLPQSNSSLVVPITRAQGHRACSGCQCSRWGTRAHDQGGETLNHPVVKLVIVFHSYWTSISSGASGADSCGPVGTPRWGGGISWYASFCVGMAHLGLVCGKKVAPYLVWNPQLPPKQDIFQDFRLQSRRLI